MTDCPHLKELDFLKQPREIPAIHREECTQCFDNQDGEEGIDVCLSCFNGGCLDGDRRHASVHHSKSFHPYALNIRRRVKARPPRSDEEPPLKKLAIAEENDSDKYEYATTLRCWRCDVNQGRLLYDGMDIPKVKQLTNYVMTSLSSARQSEVKSWEEEITACEHTLLLSSSQIPLKEPIGKHCSECDLQENLWLCMTCGNIGCGRQQFGGIGGNGHGLKHYESSHHPVAVKLGTITAEGNADIYCYDCGDSRLDPELAPHLAFFDIHVATQTKTEKSITEMQIEQNLKFDFSLVGDDGKSLEPVFGPGLTGLQNLGNSCYMASMLQALFALPSFRNRYLPSAGLHALVCPQALPADCVDCQMHKIADGLLSGRYSAPRQRPDPAMILPPKEGEPVFQEGLRPTTFKALIGKGHAEFATMRQQDSEEFLTHLLKVLRAHARKIARERTIEEPTEGFRFGVEQRLACNNCHRVRYRVDEADVASVPVRITERPLKEGEEGKKYESVQLMECIEGLMGEEELEYDCPACQKKVVATKRNRFATFPDVLVVHARKFQLVNWVPTKVDVPVILPPSDLLRLDSLLGTGLQPDEEELTEPAPGANAEEPKLPDFNEAAMEQLLGMGFPPIRCQKALLATGNEDPNSAMEWLFGHMDDPDIDDPIVLQPSASAGSATAGPEPSDEQIEALSEMGFTSAQAKKALRETGGNPERAIEWLFSHPDDSGEDTVSSIAKSSETTATTTEGATSSIGGSKNLPARYKLKSFISHKGPSVHSGHYVAHIRLDKPGGKDEWVLFNDEKVVRAEVEGVEELKALAYLWIFERI
ncbi:ubiquitinyl hydrolase [Sistotremastrum suecicum HHB10207 ss-3]|uniref:Ubiquitin carboxyl-terminal hydrolase n=1 Tax=Sistotremastrum suecicum HHB10207 ss-3 TaxID=1314776 RepID=A0A166HQ90_9AGAM|nr:ubiquitinyl hydrolase [Sistotremastrum suecicum HHB10207 ss-3]